MDFNLIDLLILVVVAFGVWRGYVAGIIREIAQLFGIFAGFAIAIQFMKPVGLQLMAIVNIVEMPREASILLAFVLIFSVVYLIIYLLARMLQRAAEAIKLGPVNKILGGALGGAKSLLVMSIIFVFLGQIDVPGKRTQDSSYLYSLVESVGPDAWEVFTQSVPRATRLTKKAGERFFPKAKEEPGKEPPSEGEMGKAIDP